MTQPNNNVSEIDLYFAFMNFYPNRHTATVEYDDDGVTEAYRQEKSVSTLDRIERRRKEPCDYHHSSHSRKFRWFCKDKKTELRINVTEKPKKLTARINNKKVKLTEVSTAAELEWRKRILADEETSNLNKFATKGSEFEKVVITKNPLLHIKLGSTDVTANRIELTWKVSALNRRPNLVSTGTCLHCKRSGKRAEQRRYILQPTGTKYPMPITMRLNLTECFIRLSGILTYCLKI